MVTAVGFVGANSGANVQNSYWRMFTTCQTSLGSGVDDTTATIAFSDIQMGVG